ncbi:Nucleotide-sugar uncharacterized transporter 2 [Glycine soja]|uniref:Nucleotide-sugar uncharacterized transporter 2 n=1 Tax=Glycine soja TaxID=3848 RepID=A0A445IK48_GLYSO|nr:Nucleotide-sugar uncharacterized transporter 2 [Glycine soja]
MLVTAGKALEDLRASLFNQFRSSEGAKCQQQCIYGPGIALSFNFLVAVGTIFMNKMALALTVVSIGVDMAIVTDLQFHVFLACVALAWIVLSIVNKILWSNCSSKRTGLLC